VKIIKKKTYGHRPAQNIEEDELISREKDGNSKATIQIE